jgi:hypothetical protein
MWKKLGNQIIDLLDNTTIADLMEETKCPEVCAFIPSKKTRKKRK